MSKHKKTIETYTIAFKTDNNFTFEDLITNDEIIDREVRVKDKDLALQIISQDENEIIGLLVTSRKHGIPPKKNHKKRTLGKIGLEDGEGLAYANVFLYEKKRKILMYEVNKFGCLIDHFIEYVYKCTNECKKFKNKSFSAVPLPLLTKDEYQRVASMPFIKSIEIQIAHPEEIVENVKNQNDSLDNVCSAGVNIGSSRINAKFEVAAKGSSTGLTSKTINEIISSAMNLFRSNGGRNIQKVLVEGYESESINKKLHLIDLIANRYLKSIELEEPRENVDLLQFQRSTKIKELYLLCKNDFDAILGK